MDILEELKEDAAHARMMALWKKGRIPFFFFIFGIVLASAVYAWYSHMHQKELDVASTIYGKSLILEEKGDTAQSIQILSQLNNTKFLGFRTLSLLFLGDMLSQLNHIEAKDKFSAVYKNSSTSKAFRYLALLKSLFLDLTIDSKKENLLESLYELQHTTTPSSSWKRFSQEVEALDSYNHHNMEKAHSLYSLIVQDPQASTSQKGRALRMLMIIESQSSSKFPTS